MEAKIGKSYLTKIPHEGGELSFQYPAFGGDTYENVAKAIDKEGLLRPTSAQTASLVYDAFQNKKGKEELEIIKILEKSWFWEFTGNLYLPKSNEEINNGVILYDTPTGDLNPGKENLFEKLQNNDSSVRFVPFGDNFEERYLIGRYGEGEADKITEIASEYKKPLKVWSFDSVDKEKTRKSALNRSWAGLLTAG